MILGTITSNIAQHLTESPYSNWRSIQVNTLIPNLITLVLVVAVVVFIFLLLSGAIQWITAGADKVQLENAQKRIMSALIGFVLVLSTWAIIRLVEHFFSIKLLGGGGATPTPTPTPP